MNLVEKAYAQDWNFFKLTLAPADSGSSYTVWTLVNSVIQVILVAAGAAAVIYLIYSGILYISAAGNPDAAKKGQQGIINAIIGIIIIVLAMVILRAVYNTALGIAK